MLRAGGQLDGGPEICASAPQQAQKQGIGRGRQVAYDHEMKCVKLLTLPEPSGPSVCLIHLAEGHGLDDRMRPACRDKPEHREWRLEALVAVGLADQMMIERVLLENASANIPAPRRLGKWLDEARPLFDHAPERAEPGQLGCVRRIGLDPEVGDLYASRDLACRLEHCDRTQQCTEESPGELIVPGPHGGPAL